MSKLRKRLEAIAERLEADQEILEKCRRRHRRQRLKSESNHEAQLAAQKAGDHDKASRCRIRATKAHDRAIYWKGRIRETTRKINHLDQTEKEIEAAIAKWQREHGAEVVGHNKVVGGTKEQRLRVAIHTAMLNYKRGDQPGYYSQEGAERIYAHGLYKYPYGHVWDCSTFADSMYFVCGLPSPSGHDYKRGGFTGTEMEHGREVSAKNARTGDLVIYLRYPGDRTGHHVEVVDDPEKMITIGHGDEAINRANGGSYDLFGDGLYVIRTYH